MRPKMLNSEMSPTKPAPTPRRRLRALLSFLKVEIAELRIADERAAEGLLQHRRGGADDADAGRHVEAQHEPQAARTAASCARPSDARCWR